MHTGLVNTTIEGVVLTLSSQFRNRVNKEGELVVVSQVYRTQHKNLDDAVHRLSDMLSQASEVPKGPSQLTMARIREL